MTVLVCQPMHDDNKGFPIAPTAENLAAALKRAADAEDNLRAEVRSNQALVAEVKALRDSNVNLRGAFDAAKQIIHEAARQAEAMDGLREELKARDQTIADLKRRCQDNDDGTIFDGED